MKNLKRFNETSNGEYHQALDSSNKSNITNVYVVIDVDSPPWESVSGVYKTLESAVDYCAGSVGEYDSSVDEESYLQSNTSDEFNWQYNRVIIKKEIRN